MQFVAVVVYMTMEKQKMNNKLPNVMSNDDYDHYQIQAVVVPYDFVSWEKIVVDCVYVSVVYVLMMTMRKRMVDLVVTT